MPDAFFLPEGDHYVPTELTRGPWDPDSQHAGPPAGLIGRELERLPAETPRRVGRVTFDILRAVPIAPLGIEARVVRPGGSVDLCEAVLSDEEGEVMRASAWRIREETVELPELPSPPMPPGPSEGEAKPFFETGQTVGYHTAMEYRFVSGAFLELGPATAWMRMRHPLVAGEEASPLVRVLVAADTGNGISAAVDYHRFLFINVDLTVHLHRYPAGEWVCLDAVTTPEPDGVGISDTALFDERGPIGRAVQTLLVDDRESGG